MTSLQQLTRALVAGLPRLAESIRSDRGTGLAEYALVLLVVVVVTAATVIALEGAVVDAIQAAIDVF